MKTTSNIRKNKLIEFGNQLVDNILTDIRLGKIDFVKKYLELLRSVSVSIGFDSGFEIARNIISELKDIDIKETAKDEKNLLSDLYENKIKNIIKEYEIKIKRLEDKFVIKSFDSMAKTLDVAAAGVASSKPPIDAPKSYQYKDWEFWVYQHLGSLTDQKFASVIGLSKSKAGTIKKEYTPKKL